MHLLAFCIEKVKGSFKTRSAKNAKRFSGKLNCTKEEDFLMLV